MAREIFTEIQIDAPAQRVWEILTDLEAHSSWNPFIRLWKGELREGAKLEVMLEPPGGRTMTFKPKLVKLVPERELCWLGHLGIPGLFDGEHRFQIEPRSDAAVRFVHAERFHGLLVPLLLGRLEASTREGFEIMNQALKHRAESPTGER
jgi:hypothetical protein